MLKIHFFSFPKYFSPQLKLNHIKISPHTCQFIIRFSARHRYIEERSADTLGISFLSTAKFQADLIAPLFFFAPYTAQIRIRTTRFTIPSRNPVRTFMATGCPQTVAKADAAHTYIQLSDSVDRIRLTLPGMSLVIRWQARGYCKFCRCFCIVVALLRRPIKQNVICVNIQSVVELN